MRLLIASLALCLLPLACPGQGTFIYDQQSSTDPLQAGGGPIIQQIARPYGQSFTPAFSAIEFIQLGLSDVNQGNGIGATVYVNLRSNTIDGPIMASTLPVFMPDGFGGAMLGGVTNFFFGATVGLTPGVVYYFQPVVQSGDRWEVSAGEYNYPGGSVFVEGGSRGRAATTGSARASCRSRPRRCSCSLARLPSSVCGGAWKSLWPR